MLFLFISFFFFSFFFFFQAEDGIRDDLVTGVQTCALPIWLPKLTTPPTAAAVAVPDNVPPPGLVPIATLTFPVKPDAVLPWASWAVTCTAEIGRASCRERV